MAFTLSYIYWIVNTDKKKTESGEQISTWIFTIYFQIVEIFRKTRVLVVRHLLREWISISHYKRCYCSKHLSRKEPTSMPRDIKHLSGGIQQNFILNDCERILDLIFASEDEDIFILIWALLRYCQRDAWSRFQFLNCRLRYAIWILIKLVQIGCFPKEL